MHPSMAEKLDTGEYVHVQKPLAGPETLKEVFCTYYDPPV
jgi:hypothetical protein